LKQLPFSIASRPIQGNFDALLSALGGARLVFGTVNSDGSINTSASNSGGWSSSRTGVGAYTLTFSPAFVRIPILLLTGWTTTEMRHPAMTSSSATITCFNSAGAALDSAFDFLAIGP
jgi:hypothetical protein